jgi:hypothetical protein
MSKELFELKKADIEVIDERIIVRPNMPVEVALQEAEDLFVWCQSDKDLLVKAGLDWTLVDDLPARTAVCRYLQSQWQKEFKEQPGIQKEWKLLSKEAYSLRNELLHHFIHAFFQHPNLLIHTKTIAKGTTHADMIQGLSDLAVLGRANPEPLKVTGLNFDLLLTAEILSEQISSLLAKVNVNKLQKSRLRVLRDRSYTYMKIATDEIRRHGQFMFWKDAGRNKGYISKYHKKQSGRSYSKK